MDKELDGKKVAILVADGFEESELEAPKQALNEAGATTVIVSPNEEVVNGWNVKEWGEQLHVDVRITHANAMDYDALLLPGGVMNSDKLRVNRDCVRLVHDFAISGKPIAAICHGPWMLVEADVIRGKTLTSWPSLKTDISNAGARWVDEEVVVDDGIVTSRKPDDIPAFNRKMIEEITEGKHIRFMTAMAA